MTMAHIAHHVPGRLRLKLPQNTREPQMLATYADLVRNLPGVIDISTNHKSGSVVIHYDPKATTGNAVLEGLNGKGPSLADKRREAAAPQPGGATVHKAAQVFGFAVGQALFNAAFKVSIERSVTTLLRWR